MRVGEVDLIPFEINRLTHPQAMPRHDEDQRRVTMPIAAFVGSADELGQLGLGEVAASVAARHAVTFHKMPVGDHPA